MLFISVLGWIAIGLVVSLVVSSLADHTGWQALRNALLSIAGALGVGFVSRLIGVGADHLDANSIVAATVGAALVLFFQQAYLRPRRRLYVHRNRSATRRQG